MKLLDPETTRRLIEGVDDIVGEAVKEEEKTYSRIRCPMCGGQESTKRVRPSKAEFVNGELRVTQSPFEGGILARGNAVCVHCGTEFDPASGVIVETEASILASPLSGYPPK